jgi:signal transduction histidine kinase
MAYLRWVDAQGTEQKFTLEQDEVLIGRRTDSDIVFAYPFASRQHAKLIKSEAGYSILNLSEVHGTYVNGNRIEQQKLQSGDRINLGQGRIELLYVADDTSVAAVLGSEPSDLERYLKSFSLVFPPDSSEQSDLAKISSILDFQYQWEKLFSSGKAFEHIVRSALKISGAERGCILLKRDDGFECVIAQDAAGRRLPVSDFHASQSVAREVATQGELIYRPESIGAHFPQTGSMVALNLRSLACLPLRWLSADSNEAKVRGVLYLDSTTSMRTISDLDEKFLKKLALEAGKVFEKIELIKTLEERKSLKLELDLMQNELLAADALRRAESQVLLSEYAGSIGRFAAALSHEFNSPLGALKNALQTSRRLAERRQAASGDKLAELEAIDAELSRTALEAVERLNQMVLRMQRITNLDRDEALPVDLNALLRDVTDLLKSATQAPTAVELDLQPLPALSILPQQMSAVFSNLLQNAIDASGAAGTVKISTRQLHGSVEIVFQDGGRGFSSEQLSHVFDPAFRVREGRVSTGNWGLFSSRQIVRECGGDISIESSPGQGTVVRIVLPIRQ